MNDEKLKSLKDEVRQIYNKVYTRVYDYNYSVETRAKLYWEALNEIKRCLDKY